MTITRRDGDSIGLTVMQTRNHGKRDAARANSLKGGWKATTFEPDPCRHRESTMVTSSTHDACKVFPTSLTRVRDPRDRTAIAALPDMQGVQEIGSRKRPVSCAAPGGPKHGTFQENLKVRILRVPVATQGCTKPRILCGPAWHQAWHATDA